MSCETCRFWQGVKDGEGACHRFPRVEYTASDWWCGEYKPTLEERYRWLQGLKAECIVLDERAELGVNA